MAATAKRHPGLPRRERALLLELVQGVKRWEVRLDYLLAHLSNLPLAKLHPLVLQLLRLGAFQILWLDRVPARAVLHEAGNLAKAKGLPRSHVGFINAVLRRLAAGEVAAPRPRSRPGPGPERDPLAPGLAGAALAGAIWPGRRRGPPGGQQSDPAAHRAGQHPEDRSPPQARLAAEGVESRRTRFSPQGLGIRPSPKSSPTELPSYQEGRWISQDEGAQLAISICSPWGQDLLVSEIGAGRGGKTTHLAEAMGNSGLLVAVDRHPRRLRELQLNLRRWGATVAHPLRADAASAVPLKTAALDAVVLDVPCSALGIIRRHPEIKSRLRESDLATFPPRQQAMLEGAARLLKPGGRLLYITCTTEPAENEDQITSFLARHPEFHLATDPGRLPPQARVLIQPPGFYRTSPADHNLDAFFAAVLAKN